MDDKIFLSVLRQLNPTYNDLLVSYSKQDTRISYLKSFELVLSVCLRDDILERVPQYIELEQKLHTHSKYKGIDKIPPDEYWLWIKNYEQIMRDEGLVGNSGNSDNSQNLDTVGYEPALAPYIKKLRGGMIVKKTAEELEEESDDDYSEEDDDTEESDDDYSEEDEEESEDEDEEESTEIAAPIPTPTVDFGHIPGYESYKDEEDGNYFDGDSDGLDALIDAAPMTAQGKNPDNPEFDKDDDTEDGDDEEESDDEGETEDAAPESDVNCDNTTNGTDNCENPAIRNNQDEPVADGQIPDTATDDESSSEDESTKRKGDDLNGDASET